MATQSGTLKAGYQLYIDIQNGDSSTVFDYTVTGASVRDNGKAWKSDRVIGPFPEDVSFTVTYTGSPSIYKVQPNGQREYTAATLPDPATLAPGTPVVVDGVPAFGGASNVPQYLGFEGRIISALYRAKDARRQQQENISYNAIYFDPSLAADAGDGSIIKPFKNITAARIKPGYRHLIKAGTTVTCTEDGAGSKRYLLVPNTATDQMPIIFGRYGDRMAADPKLVGTGVSQVLRIGTDGAYIRIRDIEIAGVGADDTNTGKFGISYNTVNAAGIQSIKKNIVLSRVKVHDVARDTSGSSDCDGVKLYGADNEIIDCDIYNVATDGLWFHGYRTIVSGNTIYNTASEYAASGRIAGDSIQCGAKSDGSIVVGNYLDHSSAPCKQCIYFEQTNSISDSITITDNYCVMADKGDGIENGQSPITCGAPNSVVARNYCKGGSRGIIISDDVECHNNFIEMTVGRGIACGNRCNIHHNTIYQSGSNTTQNWSVGVAVDSGATGTDIHSNALINMYNGIIASESDAFTEHNNAFQIRGVSLAYVRVGGTVVQQDATDVVNITSGDYDALFRPVVGSLLRGVGLDAATDKDFYPRTTRSAGCYS
jgi:hypothetical protein